MCHAIAIFTLQAAAVAYLSRHMMLQSWLHISPQQPKDSQSDTQRL
jgi:hypothetical protein